MGDILDQVLSHSLNRGDHEVRINDGRKRIDLTWVNHAEDGFFRWLSVNYRAAMVFAECKNYKDDPENPEFDQLIGRFNPRVTEFGLLLCRKVKNRERATYACRDAFKDQRGMMLVLDDDDIEKLAAMPWGSSWDEPHSKFLHDRFLQIMN